MRFTLTGIMMERIRIISLAALFLVIFSSWATSMNCPNPKSSSLGKGVPPNPWEWNPLLGHPVTRESDTFAKVDLLGAGNRGFAVACYYKSSDVLYSIWWQVPVGQPAYTSDIWGKTISGYSCTNSIEECKFNVLEVR